MTASPSRAQYATAVESISAGVLQALAGTDRAFRLAHQVQRVGDRVTGLVALRVLGADALLPFRLGLNRWCTDDAELMQEGLTRFPLPTNGSVAPTQPDVAVPLLRDWAAREAMAELGTSGVRCPFPGMSAALTEAPGTGLGWLEWSVRLAQLSPVAGLGAASPLPALIVDRARDAALGLSRALLRADRLTAARLARWISVARAESDVEVPEWEARAGVHIEAARRQLELITEASEVRTRLELAAARVRPVGPVDVDGPVRTGNTTASTTTSTTTSTRTSPSRGGGSPGTDGPGGWVASASEIASRGWTWLEGCLPHFVLPGDTVPSALNPDTHLKPLGEFALCASVALRDGERGAGARAARSLLEFSWEQLGRGDVLAARQRLCPGEVSDPFALESYVHFARAGYRHAGLEALLTHQAGLRAAAAWRESPERVFAVIAARELLGLPEAIPVAGLTPTTWLGCRPEPWSATLPALYAMTHVVYYLTDWGAHPDRLPTELVDYLDCWLPMWLEIYLEIGHWDIVGELLLVDLCLPTPQTPDAPWERLRNAQHNDGLLPADCDTPIGTGRFTAMNHYHTTGVVVSAASLGLAHHRAIAGGVEGPTPR